MGFCMIGWGLIAGWQGVNWIWDWNWPRVSHPLCLKVEVIAEAWVTHPYRRVASSFLRVTSPYQRDPTFCATRSWLTKALSATLFITRWHHCRKKT